MKIRKMDQPNTLTTKVKGLNAHVVYAVYTIRSSNLNIFDLIEVLSKGYDSQTDMRAGQWSSLFYLPNQPWA